MRTLEFRGRKKLVCLNEITWLELDLDWVLGKDLGELRRRGSEHPRE